MRLPPAATLHNIFNPRSVAVIGASESVDKLGGRMIIFMLNHRLKGRILPINPSSPESLGIPAYRRIGNAPGPIDVALLAEPAFSVSPRPNR